jgi:hypothetical protein
VLRGTMVGNCMGRCHSEDPTSAKHVSPIFWITNAISYVVTLGKFEFYAVFNAAIYALYTAGIYRAWQLTDTRVTALRAAVAVIVALAATFGGIVPVPEPRVGQAGIGALPTAGGFTEQDSSSRLYGARQQHAADDGLWRQFCLRRGSFTLRAERCCHPNLYATLDAVGVIPLLLFWQCRLWLSASRGYMTDDPIVYAARDWVSRLVLCGVLIVVATAWLPT